MAGGSATCYNKDAVDDGTSGVSKRIRFEVFKRDKFTCQYCGRPAPDVVLQADHIKPVADGGENNLLNLVTSCRDCNAGKGDKALSDDSAIQKQRHALEDLQERREQINMMLEWQNGLRGLQDGETQAAASFWSRLVNGYHLNAYGLRELSKTVRKYGLNATLEAMRTATEQYLEFPQGSDKATHESVDKAADYVGRICESNRRIEKEPYLRGIWYAKGILRKRLGRAPDREDIALMERACRAGADPQEFVDAARIVRNWPDWWDELGRIADAAFPPVGGLG